MKKYFFGISKDKMTLICLEEDNIYGIDFDNIYSLIDFIINTKFNNDEVSFTGFTFDNLKYIISYICKYKEINFIEGYNTLIVSDKKIKIRGLNYAEMD